MDLNYVLEASKSIIERINREATESSSVKELCHESICEKALRHALKYRKYDEPLKLLISNFHSYSIKYSTWIETLDEIIKEALRISQQNSNRDSQFYTSNLFDIPIPFEHIFYPALKVAKRKLSASLVVKSHKKPIAVEKLSPKAWASLEKNLLDRLAELCSQTLYNEFENSLPFGHRLLNLISENKNTVKSRKYYQAFCYQTLSDGLKHLVMTYPLLGKTMATVVDNWVNFITDFLTHLDSDFEYFSTLSTTVGLFNSNAQQIFPISEIKIGLSDPHHGGRSVIFVSFHYGGKIVYKPRSLGLEAAFYKFIKLLSTKSFLFDFKNVGILDRGTHGWMEYIEHRHCSSDEEAQEFYRCAGVILCLINVLGGTDCHLENFVAYGKYLVPIDLETLLHPLNSDIAKPYQSIEDFGVDSFEDTVLRCGFLPHWSYVPETGHFDDFSGLGNYSSESTSYSILSWIDTNTDFMKLDLITKQQDTIAPANSVLHGKALCPSKYVDRIVEGFRDTYQFLLLNRSTLTASDGPLNEFRGLQVRFVFRETSEYASILESIIAPDFFRSSKMQSTKIDVLARPLIENQKLDFLWLVLAWEIMAIEQFDIPHFSCFTDNHNLQLGLNVNIPDFFKSTGYDRIISRLNNFDENHLATQIRLIQKSFQAKMGQNQVVQDIVPQPRFSSKANLNELETQREKLLQEACLLGSRITNEMICSKTGDIGWINLVYFPTADKYQLDDIGFGFYEGSSGVALFLAALGSITDNSYFQKTAEAALRPLRRIFHSRQLQNFQIKNKLGLGIASGLGGLLYAYTKISQLLQNSEILEEVRQVVNCIKPEEILDDIKLDVIDGSAGFILGALAFWKVTDDEAALRLADAAGQNLLARQVKTATGNAWKTIASRPLTGFSHGASGIAYSLIRLYHATNDRTYLKSALNAINFERSVFSHEAQNWPDFRFNNNTNNLPQFNASWCNGVSGIGMTRLERLSVDSNQVNLDELKVSLQTALRFNLQEVDHLCCGNAGRIEFLLSASQKLSRPDLFTSAQKIATQVTLRANYAKSFRYYPSSAAHTFNPGFFQGAAGIGYTLLRLIEPKLLPSILLWD